VPAKQKGMIMENNRYTVVLHYDPQDAETHQKVIACLTRLAPNASKQFQKTEFTGRLILKRSTDPATARRLKQLINATGAGCDVHKVFEKRPTGTAEDRKTPDRSAAADRATQPPLIQCPKCGCEQPANLECRACGIIIAKASLNRPSPAVEKPDEAPVQDPVPSRILDRIQPWTRPILALIEKIQHPIDVRKLTTWSKNVADRLIRCGIVFVIALLLEIGLLSLGKMLWSLYVATAMGQYYVERLPEQAQVFQCVAEADPLALGLDVTLIVSCVSLMLGCVAQILHLIRYLYESQGIIGKLILWFFPCMGLNAWIISQWHPYPELAMAGVLAAVPTLCMLSSCLYLARTILPELGDLRVIVSIIMSNRDAAWTLIVKKIRIWFDTTKRVC
jgi:hypothetical protein